MAGTVQSSRPVATGGQPGAVRTVPGHAKTAILLDGIAEASALGRMATSLLADTEIAFSGGQPPASKPWRRAVHGTTLQWWSDAGPTPAPRETNAFDATVDLGRRATGRDGRHWCIVDATGAPLFQAFHALPVCYREPYAASLNLIESEDGGVTWQLLADAHVSSARAYPELLDVLGRTAARLLRMALLGRAPRRPWAPVPARPGPGPGQTLRGARLASRLAWLRARVGGEVYGIATLDRRPEEFLLDQRCPAAHWIQIPPSEGFIADPFFWPGQPGVLLCETYLHRTGLGELTALSVTQGKGGTGRITGSEPLPLGVTGHLSYPSTWAEDGRVFCLPEMAT